MTTQAPREFWIHKNGEGTASPDYQSVEPEEGIEDFYHVIEKSAYDQLRSSLNVVSGALESAHKSIVFACDVGGFTDGQRRLLEQTLEYNRTVLAQIERGEEK
jgi:hypothetical protein